MKVLRKSILIILCCAMVLPLFSCSAGNADKQITLEWWYRGNGQQADTELVEKALNEKLHTYEGMENVNIGLNCYPASDYYTNVTLAMSGGKQEVYLCTSEDIQQRAAMVLQDVHYVIECHFDLTDKAAPSDNPGKFQDILRRRLRKGQCYHQPCFGCREFPANFREWPGGSIPALKVTQDLGFMLHSLDYSDSANIRSQFFRAKLVDGVMECRDVEVFT